MKFRVIKKKENRFELQVGARDFICWKHYKVRGYMEEPGEWTVFRVFKTLEDAEKYLEKADPGPPMAVRVGGIKK